MNDASAGSNSGHVGSETSLAADDDELPVDVDIPPLLDALPEHPARAKTSPHINVTRTDIPLLLVPSRLAFWVKGMK